MPLNLLKQMSSIQNKIWAAGELVDHKELISPHCRVQFSGGPPMPMIVRLDSIRWVLLN